MDRIRPLELLSKLGESPVSFNREGEQQWTTLES